MATPLRGLAALVWAPSREYGSGNKKKLGTVIVLRYTLANELHCNSRPPFILHYDYDDVRVVDATSTPQSRWPYLHINR
jgi:hypothetical protein